MLLAWGDIINHSWVTTGPGGYYGIFEEQTGHGLLDAHTNVVLGRTMFEIPLPIFAIAILAFVLFVLLPYSIWLLVRRFRRI